MTNTATRDPGLVYLGQPFSHELKSVRDYRAFIGGAAAAWLTMRGICVYAPIAHGCAIDVHMPKEERKDQDMWMKQCLAVLQHCNELWVLPLPVVTPSVGLGIETDYAKAHGITVRTMETELRIADAYLFACERAAEQGVVPC